MRLCVGVAECATAQTLHHLHHFPPFLFIHFTWDARRWPLARGAERGRGTESLYGGSRHQPFYCRNRSKGPVKSNSERPFAMSLTSPAGHKIKREFSRTLHRNIEDFVSTLGSSNKTKVGFVLVAICWFSLGEAGMGWLLPAWDPPLVVPRCGVRGGKAAWMGLARLRTGATLNKLRLSGQKAEPQLRLSLGNNRESGELLVGIWITENLLKNKCEAITEIDKRLICD